MSRRDDRVTLAQMLDTAREIEAAVHGRTLDELRTNRMFELALLHLFVQLGETSRRITSEGRTQHAAIPWHQINGSPFAEPDSHWAYDRETQRFERKPGRRPASYTIATPGVDSYDDPVSPAFRSVFSIPGAMRSATSASSLAAPTS